MASQTSLPDADSPNVILTVATDKERIYVYKANHPSWGAPLTVEGYLGREAHLSKTAAASNGRLTGWILTDATLPPDSRPVLASCETFKKPSLVADQHGVVKDVNGYAIASVYTESKYRGKGYASRMMSLLAQKLEEDGAFSVLWSDIGKKFYNALGWKPYESTYLAFPAAKDGDVVDEAAKPIAWDDIPALVERDEQLLRQKLSAPSSNPGYRAALIPDLDNIQWHLIREAYVCEQTFSRAPSVLGAVYCPPGAPNSRVWAIWARSLYGGTDKPEKSVINVVRTVVEDDGMSDEALTRAMRAIASVARKEAKDWACGSIEFWNPGERIAKLVAKADDLESQFVVRETDNLASLNWSGEGSVDNVEWVANERFGWC